MNKKLFLKLGLLLLSLLFVSCGQDSTSAREDNSSKTSTSQAVSSTESSQEESIKTTSPSVETTVESKLEDEDVKPDTQDTPKENTQQNANQEVKQGLTEEEYYIIIKEAKKRQQDYIDSIDDPKIKQSVQTSYAAAVAESSFLYLKYPEDTDIIDAALKRVLNGE